MYAIRSYYGLNVLSQQEVARLRQAGHAAELVDHDGHVVARNAEFAEQHIEALRFRNEDSRPQPVAQFETLFGLHAQQILGEQDAENVVAVTIDRNNFV